MGDSLETSEVGILRMEDLWHRFGEAISAFVITIFSALGGVYVKDKRKAEARFLKLEAQVMEHKRDIAVVQESVKNIKEDTNDIKASQQHIINILTRSPK